MATAKKKTAKKIIEEAMKRSARGKQINVDDIRHPLLTMCVQLLARVTSEMCAEVRDLQARLSALEGRKPTKRKKK